MTGVHGVASDPVTQFAVERHNYRGIPNAPLVNDYRILAQRLQTQERRGTVICQKKYIDGDEYRGFRQSATCAATGGEAASDQWQSSL